MKQSQKMWIPFEGVEAPGERTKKNKIWESIYDFSSSVMTAIVIIFVLFTFVFRAVSVSGSSMEPTLSDEDFLIVTSRHSVYERGDVVIVTQPNILNEHIVKRIIALEGQEVDINFNTGEVFVDGELQNEEYVASPTNRSFDIDFPVTVPKGEVFVMGDNRNESLDSRSSVIGMIDERYLFGKVLFRLLPFGSWKIG